MSRIGFVLKGYPRLSETFIAQEIHLLEQRGFEIEIFSMRQAREKERQPINDKIKASVTYIPEYVLESPSTFALNWLRTFFRFPLTTLGVGVRALLKTILKKSHSPFKRYLQGTWLISRAKLGATPTRHLHSHFAHTPTEMTYYISKITGLTFSISAHAKDIYTISKSELRTRINASQFLMTCTSYNFDFLQEIPGLQHEKVHKVYHGVNPDFFKTEKLTPIVSSKDPVHLLTVGRLVEKKGYSYILEALANLKRRGYDFVYTVYGSGDLLEQLQNQIIRLQLTDRVRLMGHATHTEILETMKERGIYVNGSVQARNGDRDGIPNTLAEAMSMCWPVVATTVSGIPELIRNEREGLLVNPNDAKGLADAIAKLIEDPRWAEQLGLAGRKRVIDFFNCHSCIDKCDQLLRPFSKSTMPQNGKTHLLSSWEISRS